MGQAAGSRSVAHQTPQGGWSASGGHGVGPRVGGRGGCGCVDVAGVHVDTKAIWVGQH